MKKRSLGVTIIGCFFVFIGGFTTLVVFIYGIDSVRIWGLESLLIDNVTSFRGFMMFGVLPILSYSTGIGLLMLRTWAWYLTIFFLPILSLFFLTTIKTILFWIIGLYALVFYFISPNVRAQFNKG